MKCVTFICTKANNFPCYNNGLPESIFILVSPLFLKINLLEAALGLVLSQVFSSVKELRCKDEILWLEDVGLHLNEDDFVANGTLRNFSEEAPILLPDRPCF